MTILIKLYITFISPILRMYFGHACRYTPTCSQYMLDSVKKYGTLKGTLLGLYRLLHCNPLGGFGFDPVK